MMLLVCLYLMMHDLLLAKMYQLDKVFVACSVDLCWAP